MAKQPRIFHVSPAGIAKFPWIHKADAKFDKSGDGHYKTGLLIPKDQAGELIEKITAAAKAAQAALIKENPKKKTFGLYLPFRDELDDEGKETGNVEFTFKNKAVVRIKGKEPWVKTIAVFDAKKTPLKGVPIGSGSTIKVRYEFIPIVIDAGKQMGVQLRFDAVQVLDLKTYQGGQDASGFTEEPDGYVGEPDAPEAAVGASGGSTNGDF